MRKMYGSPMNVQIDQELIRRLRQEPCSKGVLFGALRITEDYSEVIVYKDGKQFGEIRRYRGGNGEWDVSNEIMDASKNVAYADRICVKGYRSLPKLKEQIELLLMF